MDVPFTLDRALGALIDPWGRRLDPQRRLWAAMAPPASGATVSAREAAAWLQRESGCPCRAPVGVVGPRAASGPQLQAAEQVGRRLAEMGVAVLCGGGEGVMAAACRGAALGGGVAVGLLPGADPAAANPHAGLVLATGIGEARNAVIACAALCLVAIGDSWGTLSEVALGLRFGKTVIGLEGAARGDGVAQTATVADALEAAARCVLAWAAP
jgi:uncharacterized protein (TIGR00725 family)